MSREKKDKNIFPGNGVRSRKEGGKSSFVISSWSIRYERISHATRETWSRYSGRDHYRKKRREKEEMLVSYVQVR